MEQNIQNNKELNELFKYLVNAVNTPFNFKFQPMYENEEDEELAFSSFIQPNCQPGYNGFNRFLD